MAVIHLFDSRKQHKRLVRRGVQEIIHNEGEYNATAQFMSKDAPAYGDHFGFRCADGRFRIFLINDIEITDQTNTCTVTGTDAAIAELDGKVVETLGLNDTTAQEAARKVLEGTGWRLGSLTGDGAVKAADAYFTTVWAVMKTISAAAKVRVVPYFEFADGTIVGRKVDVLDRTPVFRGLIYTRKKGAQNIHIFKEGIPYGRVFPVGRIIGSGDPPERVTIADVEWTTVAGKPVNKPKGQKYIDLPGAISAAEYVYQDNREEDPEQLAQKALEDLESKQQAHATGTAVIGDMSRMPGYAMRAPELWELVVIRTEEGDSAEATVTNVERYYVHSELTKLHIGEENEATFEEYIARLSEASEANASAAGSAGAGARENKQLILNAEELIQLNSKRIELNAEEILLRATKTEVLELEEETAVQFNEVYIDLDAAKAQIELKASQTVVDNLGNQVDSMSATLTIQAQQISSKVEKNGVISAINQTAEEVKIAAARINLEGYVKASELETTNATISNLMSGLTAATVLETNLLNASQANVTYLSANALNIADISTQFRTVSMGSVMSHRFVVESTTGDISLQHSHAVSVNETTGQVQLGEVSETGGNFNIADTQFFKDAVAAAGGGDITLTAAGWISNGENIVTASTSSKTKTLAVKLPTFNVSGGDSWTSAHKTTVHFSTDSVTGPLKSKEVDASSVYEAGKPTKITRTSYSTTSKTVTVKASNASGDLLTGQTIDASEIYTTGYNAGWDKGYDDGVDVGYDNGYTAGYNAAKNDCTIHYSNFTITNPAQGYYKADVYIYARIGGSTVASSNITKTQQFS